MQHYPTRILFAGALSVAITGCATQPSKYDPHENPLCIFAGAVVGGGSVAAATAAAGPIGAGVLAGAVIGHFLCPRGAPMPVAKPMAAVVSTPMPTTTVVELDSDSDGVIDRLDRCPDTPAGKKVDVNGCPDILLTLTGVNFKFDSSRIEPASESILHEAVDALNKASSVAVRIEGHTDSVGSDAYNLLLSQRRAKAVADYLVHHGVSGARLTTEGKGERQPVASNATADGRYQNRRVELHVVGSVPRFRGRIFPEHQLRDRTVAISRPDGHESRTT
ncbi:MAG: OmpA family protein [Gammaproteobacteria bacterium]|nr:OmpA family protein [Gammaproteobacteria bacterium]